MLRDNNVNFSPHQISNSVALDGKIRQSHLLLCYNGKAME